ncbi:MAG: nucleotidyl transferase AbiEii/AbiGii toxin family protein [Polyangiaceae bacterium]|nr:nucleotidyl transferase AbiEii/AbiGii toxin family protein [Polyangiaceae bacterium]
MATPLPTRLYLVGGAAIGHHLGHRTSLDLDLFTEASDAGLSTVRAAFLRVFPDAEIVAETDVTLRIRTADGPVDLVRYPYPLLEPLQSGPEGCPVAGLRDLAVMKMSAIAKRGLRRDFWDLHEILTRCSVSLDSVMVDYVTKFGLAEANAYHVFRSLTYFADAERDVSLPLGLTEGHWTEVKAFFEREVPQAFDRFRAE